MKNQFNIQIICISFITKTVLSTSCAYTGYSSHSSYAYGYSIKYRYCRSGCCGHINHTYCCKESDIDWKLIVIVLISSLVGLVFISAILCICARMFSGCSKERNRSRRDTEVNVTSDSTQGTSSHINTTASMSCPGYAPYPFTNPTFIADDKDEAPPPYEEAISTDYCPPIREQ